MASPLFLASLDAGRRRLEAGDFHAAHEAWEAGWRGARGDERLVLQALVLWATALHHHERGKELGATRLLHRALERLTEVDEAFDGFDPDALREALVTHYGRSTRRVPMTEPGPKGLARQRERITAELNELWRRASGGTDEERAASLKNLPPAPREPLDHLKPLERLRSDLARLGFAEGSSTTNQLRSSLDARMNGLATLLEGPPPPDVFLNLSDTAIEGWTEEQLEATRALGCGEAVELLGGLPELDPDMDDDQIEQIARDLASRAVAQGAAGVCVDTDPSLTFALVAELQARGIKCFAPATRKVTEEREVDGVLRKKTTLRCARWRPFARTAGEEE